MVSLRICCGDAHDVTKGKGQGPFIRILIFVHITAFDAWGMVAHRSNVFVHMYTSGSSAHRVRVR